MEPVVNRLGEEFKGKVEVNRIDCNAKPEVAAKFNVQGVPTYVFLDSGGTETARQLGGSDEATLRQKFEQAAKSE